MNNMLKRYVSIGFNKHIRFNNYSIGLNYQHKLSLANKSQFQLRNYNTNGSNSGFNSKKSSNLSKKLGSLALLGGVYLSFKDDIDFYLSSCSRGLIAGGTGILIILDYKFNWPGEADKLKLNESELKDLKSKINLRNANRMLEAMKYNGGVYIKLGQHLSALGYFLPSEWTETFRPLHDNCPKSDIKEIDQMIFQDLGKTINELFSEFDSVPLGTASIAQVHKARLRASGQEVAIKIQHPKVASYSILDLKVTTAIVKLAKWAIPEFEFTWLADEMNRNLPMELDFNIEGENATKANKNFQGLTYALKIPEVYWANKRIICMEYVEGCKLNDAKFMKDNNIDPNEVSREVTKIFSEMIYRHGWVHCDAHPGNLMIRPSTGSKNFEVVLLDHGLYRYLPQEFRIQYANLWLSIINKNIESIRKYSLALGGTDVTFMLITSILTGHTWNTITSDSPIDAPQSAEEREHINDTISAFIPLIATLLSQVPRELIFLFKTQDLLKLVHSDLHATQDQKIQYLIMANYCTDLIYQDQVSSIFFKPATSHSSLKVNSTSNLFSLNNIHGMVHAWLAYWSIKCKLTFYSLALQLFPWLALS